MKLFTILKKSICFIFLFSISTFAMEQQNINKKTLTSWIRSNFKFNKPSLAEVAIGCATIPMTTFVHELGHYSAFNYFYPGSAKSITIYPSLFNGITNMDASIIKDTMYASTNLNPHFYKCAFGVAAGPIAGIAFSSGALAGLNLWDHYQETKDLKQAFQRFKKNPLYSPGNYQFIQSLIYLNAWMNLNNLFPSIPECDGYKLLQILQFEESTIKQLSRASYLLLNGAALAGAAYFSYKIVQEINKKNNVKTKEINIIPMTDSLD